MHARRGLVFEAAVTDAADARASVITATMIVATAMPIVVTAVPVAVRAACVMPLARVVMMGFPIASFPVAMTVVIALAVPAGTHHDHGRRGAGAASSPRQTTFARALEGCLRPKSAESRTGSRDTRPSFARGEAGRWRVGMPPGSLTWLPWWLQTWE